MSDKILRWCATCNEATESWFGMASDEHCVGCESNDYAEDDDEWIG